jgi:hypothetical protein
VTLKGRLSALGVAAVVCLVWAGCGDDKTPSKKDKSSKRVVIGRGHTGGVSWKLAAYTEQGHLCVDVEAHSGRGFSGTVCEAGYPRKNKTVEVGTSSASGNGGLVTGPVRPPTRRVTVTYQGRRGALRTTRAAVVLVTNAQLGAIGVTRPFDWFVTAVPPNEGRVTAQAYGPHGKLIDRDTFSGLPVAPRPPPDCTAGRAIEKVPAPAVKSLDIKGRVVNAMAARTTVENGPADLRAGAYYVAVQVNGKPALWVMGKDAFFGGGGFVVAVNDLARRVSNVGDRVRPEAFGLSKSSPEALLLRECLI